MCTGSNVPPKIPNETAVCNLANLPVSDDDELLRGQLTKAHRAEGVELRGGNPNLRAKPQLKPVVKPSRGVDHAEETSLRIEGRL